MWRVSILILFSSFVLAGCANEPTTLRGYGDVAPYEPAPRREPPPDTEDPPSFDEGDGSFSEHLVAASFSGTIGRLSNFYFDRVFVSGGSGARATDLYLDAEGEDGAAMLVLMAGASIYDLATGSAEPVSDPGIACSSSPASSYWEDEVYLDGWDVGEPVLLEGGQVAFDVTARLNFEGAEQHIDARLTFATFED